MDRYFTKQQLEECVRSALQLPANQKHYLFRKLKKSNPRLYLALKLHLARIRFMSTGKGRAWPPDNC